MDTNDQLSGVLPPLCDVVDHLWHQQLAQPMPGGGTVHEALDRMMVLGATYTYLLRGEEVPELTPPTVYGWVPAAEFREVMEDLLDAAARPGSAERTIRTEAGDVSGDELIRRVAVGALLCGLELALATGRSFSPAVASRAAIDPFAVAP